MLPEGLAFSPEHLQVALRITIAPRCHEHRWNRTYVRKRQFVELGCRNEKGEGGGAD